MIPITQGEIDDMLFAAKAMGLARCLANLDTDRLNGILKDGFNNPRAILGGEIGASSFHPQIRASLAIILFAATELKKFVPEVSEVAKQNSQIMSMFSTEAREEINKIVSEQLEKD